MPAADECHHGLLGKKCLIIICLFGKLRCMTLAEWMRQSERRDADIARELGISHSYLLRLKRGERQPSMRVAAKIVSASGGAVQATDFFPITPEAAE